MTIEIRELDVYPEDDGAPSVYYRAEEITGKSTRGEDYGALLVRLNVDGEGFDVVQVELNGTGDLEALDRALAAVRAARADLGRLYGANGAKWRGRCMTAGGWGRCYLDSGHDEDHEFPTE